MNHFYVIFSRCDNCGNKIIGNISGEIVESFISHNPNEVWFDYKKVPPNTIPVCNKKNIQSIEEIIFLPIGGEN